MYTIRKEKIHFSPTIWITRSDSGNLILVCYIVRNMGDITRAQAWVYLGTQAALC